MIEGDKIDAKWAVISLRTALMTSTTYLNGVPHRVGEGRTGPIARTMMGRINNWCDPKLSRRDNGEWNNHAVY